MEISSANPVIDLDALLAPISEENPSGESLQYSGVYDEIREARRADKDVEQGSWKYELKVADWRKVISVAVPALTTQTKDLQIAAWLAEALLKQHGFAGLRDSLKLVRGFHENFWETLFPEIDEGNDMEARANALEFMDKQTAFALKEVAVTSGGLSFFAWEESKSFDVPENLDSLDSGQQEKYRELQQQAAEEKRTTGEMWRKAKNSTRRQFYEQVFHTLEECWTEFQELDRKADDRFGNQTPGLGQLKKSLDGVRDLVKKLTEESRQKEPTEAELAAGLSGGEVETGEDGFPVEGGGNGTGYAVAGGVAATSGAIRGRQDALKRLSEVAQFFQQTEPHSPVAHLVNRAVKWGNMPLESWLQDVIKDESVLGQIRETLGLESYSSNGSSESYE